jgi:hypothetical protein
MQPKGVYYRDVGCARKSPATLLPGYRDIQFCVLIEHVILLMLLTLPLFVGIFKSKEVPHENAKNIPVY